MARNPSGAGNLCPKYPKVPLKPWPPNHPRTFWAPCGKMTMARVHRRMNWITLASVAKSHILSRPPLRSDRALQAARPDFRAVERLPSGIEGAATCPARPHPDHVALPVRLRGVAEVGPAVGEREVVDDLDLTALDRELHAELR